MLWADSSRQLARWWWIHLHKVTKSEKSTRSPALKWVEWCRNMSVDSQHYNTSVIVQWSSGCQISLWVKHCSLWQSVNEFWLHIGGPCTHLLCLPGIFIIYSCKTSKWLSSHDLVSHICTVTHICLSRSCPLLQCCCPNFPPFLRYFLQTNRAHL